MEPVKHGTNSILSSFSPQTLAALNPQDETTAFGRILARQGEECLDVWFPRAGTVISQVRSMSGGQQVEIGLVGSEGLFSFDGLLDTRPLFTHGIVQVAGSAARVSRINLTSVLEDRLVRERLLAAAGAHLEQVTQNAACNRYHSVEQRLCKWILMMSDRAGEIEFQITHEFISFMLGIRRAGVSIAVGNLTKDGMLDHSRNRLRIRDVDAMEARACECLGVVRNAIERSLAA
jgi:CRP-like cAMP-binding protein